MKFISLERGVTVVFLLVAIYGTVTATNYVRDHEVYRATAAQCNGDKGILQQEIEELQAANNLKDDKVSDLEKVPVR